MASSQNDVVKSLTVGASILDGVADFLSSKKSLSDDDYSRYRDMTTAYGRYIKPKDNNCPLHWDLDSKRKPKYSISFKDAKENIERDLKQFDDQSLKGDLLMVKNMASRIMAMFNSLNKRKSIFNYVREDGIECMFMYEMARWIMHDLVRLDLTDSKNIQLIKDRLNYYQHIEEEVFQYHSDENKTNPKDTLKSIIDELKHLDISMRQRHRVASFNVQVELIEKSLSSILSNTFNILYFMIADSKQDVSVTFDISQFRNPAANNSKMRERKKFLLSQWLEQSLKVVGLSHNDFISENDFSYDYLTKHLEINEVKFNAIGLEDFMKKAFDEGELNPFLTQVIQLHRSILRIYFIRKLLKSSQQVTNSYGETWLFDNNDGKAIFEGLMDALKDGITKHQHIFNRYSAPHKLN